MGSLEHNGGHCSYPKTPSQHFDIIKSELPNHFMRNFKIIIDHRQISSTVTTPRSKSKCVYQKFIPEFVLSLFCGIKLVLFMFFYHLSNSLMPISFGILLTMFLTCSIVLHSCLSSGLSSFLCFFNSTVR